MFEQTHKGTNRAKISCLQKPRISKVVRLNELP